MKVHCVSAKATHRLQKTNACTGLGGRYSDLVYNIWQKLYDFTTTCRLLSSSDTILCRSVTVVMPCLVFFQHCEPGRSSTATKATCMFQMVAHALWSLSYAQVLRDDRLRWFSYQ